MRKYFISLTPLLFFILSLLICSCVEEDFIEGKSLINIGDKVPEFSVIMKNGTQISTEDLIGRKSLIMFFTTRCPDCRKTLPIIEEVHRLLPDIMIICISRDESNAGIESYWNANDLTLPYSAQSDRRIYNLFATESVPRIYISDEQLKVIATFDDKDMPNLEQILFYLKS